MCPRSQERPDTAAVRRDEKETVSRVDRSKQKSDPRLPTGAVSPRTGGEPPHSQDLRRVAPPDQQSSPQAARTPDVSPRSQEKPDTAAVRRDEKETVSRVDPSKQKSEAPLPTGPRAVSPPEPTTAGVPPPQSPEIAAQRQDLMGRMLTNVLLPTDAQDTYRQGVLAFRNSEWARAASLFGRAATFHADLADARVSIGANETMRYLPNLYAAQAFRQLGDCGGVERSLAKLEAEGIIAANPDIESDARRLRLWCVASALKK